jgi:hypothetical protein
MPELGDLEREQQGPPEVLGVRHLDHGRARVLLQELQGHAGVVAARREIVDAGGIDDVDLPVRAVLETNVARALVISTVVPGKFETLTYWWVRFLNSRLLPTFGLPTRRTVAAAARAPGPGKGRTFAVSADPKGTDSTAAGSDID